MLVQNTRRSRCWRWSITEHGLERADIIDAGSFDDDTVISLVVLVTILLLLVQEDDSLVATAENASTQKVVVTDFEDAGDTSCDTVTLAG